MKPNKITVFIALALSAFLWGSSVVANKVLLRELTPITIAFFRLAIASIIILPFFLKEQKKKRVFKFKHLPIFLFSALNFWIFLIGLKLTTPIAPLILYAATPLIVAIFSSLFLKEHLTVRKISGILIGLVGALIVIIIPAVKSDEALFGSFWGNVIIFFAVCCWAAYTTGSRYLSKDREYSPVSLMAFSFFTSTALFIAIAAFQGFELLLPALTVTNMLLLIYLGFFVTVATFFLYQWAIKHSSANTASLMTYLQPPSGFFLAWIFLGSTLAWEFVVGTAIAFFGVFSATSGNRFKKKPSEAIIPEAME